MSFSLTLSHVGIFVTDVKRMVDLYARFPGFVVSDRAPREGGEIVFTTRDPREQAYARDRWGRYNGDHGQSQPARKNGYSRHTRR